MIRFGRLLCLLLAAGGFAAAHVLVQPGQAMDAPTVTVPTAPAPTVPVPSTPTTTAPSPPPVAMPAPPPVRLPPVTTSPLPTAPAPRPARPSTTTLSVASQRSARRTSSPRFSGYGASTPSARPRSGTARRGGARPAARALEAKTHRTPHRVSVRLTFALPQARHIFLVVRGPAPACRTAGSIPVRGRKGANSVYFAGRVHGRRLEPGVYLISISRKRSPVPGAPTEYVRVVSTRRSVPLPDSARKPSCGVAAASTIGPIEPFPPADPLPRAPVSRPTARLAGAATASPAGNENDDAAGLPDSGVLGATTDGAKGHAFAGIALLAFVGVLLLAMLALVTRFLRGSWNP